VTDCIAIDVGGGIHAIRRVRESWDAVRNEAAQVRRVGPCDAQSAGRLSVYVVEPGARHYLVEDGGREMSDTHGRHPVDVANRGCASSCRSG
jgi:hypothetical protein